MTPLNSLFLLEDGKSYSVYIWINPEKAKHFIIDIELAKSVYPNRNVREAVRMLAYDRFTKSTD